MLINSCHEDVSVAPLKDDARGRWVTRSHLRFKDVEMYIGALGSDSKLAEVDWVCFYSRLCCQETTLRLRRSVRGSQQE